MNKTAILMLLACLYALPCLPTEEEFSYGKDDMVEIYYGNASNWGPDGRVYFLKQISYFKKGWGKAKQENKNGIYLCSMNSDGTDKKELKKVFQKAKIFMTREMEDQFLTICFKTWDIVFGDANHLHGIWIMNFQKDEDFRRIIDYGHHPAINKDGTKIAFQTGNILDTKIWIYDRDNKQISSLSQEEGEMEPSFSPIEDVIAFQKLYPKDPQWMMKGELWIMDIEGKNRRLLVSEKSEGILSCPHYPHFSSFTNKIFFRDHGVQGFNLDAGKLERFQYPFDPKWPRVSKDERWFVEGGGLCPLFEGEREKATNGIQGVYGCYSKPIADRLNWIDKKIMW